MSDAEAPAPVQWPLVIKLARPIEFAGETISALSFRRGRLGDLKGMTLEGLPSVEQLALIASRMCAQPVKAIESLEDEDAPAVLEVALSFFARCLGAGKTQ